MGWTRLEELRTQGYVPAAESHVGREINPGRRMRAAWIDLGVAGGAIGMAAALVILRRVDMVGIVVASLTLAITSAFMAGGNALQYFEDKTLMKEALGESSKGE